MGRLHDLVKAHRVQVEADTAESRRRAKERMEQKRKIAIQLMERLLNDLGVEAPIEYVLPNVGNEEDGRATALFNFEGHDIRLYTGQHLQKPAFKAIIDKETELMADESMDLVKTLAAGLAGLEEKDEYW